MSEANKDKSGEQGSLLHRAVQKIENVFDGLKKDLQEAREHARAGEQSSSQPQQESQQQQQSKQHESQPQEKATTLTADSSSSSSSSSQPQSSKTWHWKGLDEEAPKPAGDPGWQGQQTETGHGGYGSGSSPKHATTQELNANAATRPQAIDLHGGERGGGAGLGSPYTTGVPVSSTSGSVAQPKLLDTPSSFAAERDFSANLSEYAKQQHIGSRYHTDSASTQSSHASQSSAGSQSSVMAGSSLSSSHSTPATGIAQAGQSEQAPVESGFGGTIDNSSWRAGVAGSTSQLSSGPDYGDLKSPKHSSEMQE